MDEGAGLYQNAVINPDGNPEHVAVCMLVSFDFSMAWYPDYFVNIK